MITSVRDFVRYFEGVRRRTVATVDRVTPALAAFKPRPDEWSCGEAPQLYGYRMEEVVVKVGGPR
jgi:hypothetical protein